MIRETTEADDATRTCSFCGQRRGEARVLVAGPAATICDACVALCSEVVAGRGAGGAAEPRGGGGGDDDAARDRLAAALSTYALDRLGAGATGAAIERELRALAGAALVRVHQFDPAQGAAFAGLDAAAFARELERAGAALDGEVRPSVAPAALAADAFKAVQREVDRLLDASGALEIWVLDRDGQVVAARRRAHDDRPTSPGVPARFTATAFPGMAPVLRQAGVVTMQVPGDDTTAHLRLVERRALLVAFFQGPADDGLARLHADAGGGLRYAIEALAGPADGGPFPAMSDGEIDALFGE